MTPSEIVERLMKNLVGAIGRMGYSDPPADFSGVTIGGKTYPVRLRNDGCFVYFDEKGKRHDLASVPRAEYEFTNIEDARTSIVNQCYRTPGGQVEVRIHTYMNNKDETLSMKVTVVNSTDVDIPIDKEYKEVPAEWVAIDCSIAEMTDREVVAVDKCFTTPGGKVEVVGIESVDPKINQEAALYEVLRTTDPDIAAGTIYRSIPANWTRMVCDFPDMTQREITPILKCYDTPTGRVQIEGYKVFDYEMSVRMEWYRVKQSTDPDNPVGEIIVGVPDDWEEVVCDFTDMEDRDIEVTTECYSTDGGKVKLEVLTSWDGNIGVRTREYKVLETTDAAYPANTQMSALPGSWVRIVCDFTDMEDRNVFQVEECYKDANDNAYKVSVLYTYDGNIGKRGERMVVLESENEGQFSIGSTINAMPGDWERMECDFADRTQRLIGYDENCYATGNGTVKVRWRRIFDAFNQVERAYGEVVSSSDSSIQIGTSVTNDTILDWTLAECDIPDMTERHIVKVSECYDSDGGKVYLSGYRVYDNKMNVREERLTVEESSDPAYQVGDVLNAVPAAFTFTPCLCKTC